MDLKEFYKIVGGNYNEVSLRLSNKDMVLRFVKKFESDPTFSSLKESVSLKEYKNAFRHTHTLKGLSLTLGFNNLSISSSNLTEYLRNNEQVDENKVMQLFVIVEADYNKVIDNIKEIK